MNPDQNRLSQESSPYLLQHKDQPVHWWPWGEDAFREARRRDVPVFLSIGYSTCHWCHVMAHESFDDREVADALNAGFVSVKVDREERPDVDDVYMKSVLALTGGGGWPMSVWLFPDGRPFFAGTYFPKYRFLQLLRRIGQIWSEERDALANDSERLMAAIRRPVESEAGDETDDDDQEREAFLQAYTTHFQYYFDEQHGGFGQAPKFPQTMNLMTMMRQDLKSDTGAAEVLVTRTLQGMSRGGMYDHLAGGFHRYSVDQEWLVPHFEKMLYDQAWLSLTFMEAGLHHGDPEFHRVARETLDYVRREMTDPGGGFYSAQDADSLNPESGHADEGYFATFAHAELGARLGADEIQALAEVYGVRPAGHFEGRNILHLQEGFDRMAARSRPELGSALEKLREMRARRPQPHLDDKIITAWNGWMIAAMAFGARIYQSSEYAASANAAMAFVRERLWRDGELFRYWRAGAAKGRGTAEDYAALIHACIELYQVGFDPALSRWAVELQKRMDELFWDGEDGGYFTDDGREGLLPMRVKEDHDGVTPCANSMAAHNLVRLHALTGEPAFRVKADRVFSWLYPKLRQSPSALPYLAIALDWDLAPGRVAVAAGEWSAQLQAESASRFLPHVIWARPDTGWPVTAAKGEGLWVCEAGQCLAPASTESAARAQLGLN